MIDGGSVGQIMLSYCYYIFQLQFLIWNLDYADCNEMYEQKKYLFDITAHVIYQVLRLYTFRFVG